MCGINGIFTKNGQRPDSTAIRAMNGALSHRGPDDDGTFENENIALGHRRLSIIDLSSAGHQPMESDDGRYVLVFNGEIYNYRELKEQLKSYRYTSDSDSEVLLAAYKQWGVDCLQHLNGMFAFAIWDKKKKKLFVARDRLGIKPLYYHKNESTVLFSSEIRALLQSGAVPRKINREGLIDYLRYQTVHAPDTIVQDVSVLMPGHYMLISDSNVEINSYWSLDNAFEKKFDSDYQKVTQTVKRLLTESVERRLVADVPFGAFLSGGIDSSIIVALMSQLIPGKVNTFSVTFDEQTYSEAPYSKLIADKYDTNHTEIKLKADDFLQYLPDALSAMDHPSGDGPNTYVVSRVTREAGVTMALSGLGGDELFAGYPIFKRSATLQKFSSAQYIPRSIRAGVGSALTKIHPSVLSKKLDAILSLEKWDFESSYPLSRQLLLDSKIQEILSNDVNIAANKMAEHLSREISNLNGIPRLSVTSIAEISTYMQNVLLRDTDQMSMASALEVRVPFLDHKLVEYVLNIRDKFKYPHTPKKLLTDSLSEFIPDEISNRKKMGFELPWKVWLKNELRARVEQNFENLAERSFTDAPNLFALWDDFLRGEPSTGWSQIWTLVVLEEWLERNDMRY